MHNSSIFWTLVFSERYNILNWQKCDSTDYSQLILIAILEEHFYLYSVAVMSHFQLPAYERTHSNSIISIEKSRHSMTYVSANKPNFLSLRNKIVIIRPPAQRVLKCIFIRRWSEAGVYVSASYVSVDVINSSGFNV